MSASIKEKMRLIGRLNDELKKRGLAPVVVVGGSAVEFLTLGRLYKSEDIDITVTSVRVEEEREAIIEILKSWGFEGLGRTYHHSEFNITIDVLGSLENASKDKITKLEYEGLEILVVGVEDAILDRMRSCIYWNWKEDCELARGLLLVFREKLDVDYLLSTKDTEVKEVLMRLLEKISD